MKTSSHITKTGSCRISSTSGKFLYGVRQSAEISFKRSYKIFCYGPCAQTYDIKDKHIS